jgi:DNA-binding NtrC family response regulator
MARILVVDDSDQNLTLIELYLRGSEFEVDTAGGGHEALERCRLEQFDLILLDVVMPGIDGIEVCRRLKNDPRTAFVPVIFLTGRLGDESDKVTAYQAGAVDYIQKPVNREELIARIRVMLRLEEARTRLERENVVLRRQLTDTQRALEAAEDRLAMLDRLRREFGAGGEGAALVVDAAGALVAADRGAAALLGEIVPGAPLAAAGMAGARLARALEAGASATDLPFPGSPVPGAGGPPRIFELRVHVLAGGAQRVALLRDVTSVRGVEREIADREPHELAVRERRSASGYSISGFVGRSSRVEEAAAMVDRLRQTRSTVLIQGESGTGKEIVARALHFDGSNRSAPFIPIHCGAIARDVVESELFGHEKGAFTGAQQSRDGLFRAADGGTIFLDEIGEMSTDLQVKLLRVLQMGEIRPVGANHPRIVDVRIIAATNRDLLQMVRDGTFREDLYYRLEVVKVHLAPLRERVDDLPLLVDHFVRRCNRRHERTEHPVRGVSQGAMARILAYPWPGNVRELENVIERAFALGVGEMVQEEDLPAHVVRGMPVLGPTPVLRPTPAQVEPRDPDRATSTDLRQHRQAAEREVILQALAQEPGDKLAAARRLGMSRSTFYRRLKELGLGESGS